MSIEEAYIDMKNATDSMDATIRHTVSAQDSLNPEVFSLFSEKASVQEEANSRIGQIKTKLTELQTEISGLNELFESGENIGGKVHDASQASLGHLSSTKETADSADNYLRRAGLPTETVDGLILPIKENAALAVTRLETLGSIGTRWVRRFSAAKEEVMGITEVVTSLNKRFEGLSEQLAAVDGTPDEAEQVHSEPRTTMEAVSDTRESAIRAPRDLGDILARLRANRS